MFPAKPSTHITFAAEPHVSRGSESLGSMTDISDALFKYEMGLQSLGKYHRRWEMLEKHPGTGRIETAKGLAPDTTDTLMGGVRGDLDTVLQIARRLSGLSRVELSQRVSERLALDESLVDYGKMQMQGSVMRMENLRTWFPATFATHMKAELREKVRVSAAPYVQAQREWYEADHTASELSDADVKSRLDKIKSANDTLTEQIGAIMDKYALVDAENSEDSEDDGEEVKGSEGSENEKTGEPGAGQEMSSIPPEDLLDDVLGLLSTHSHLAILWRLHMRGMPVRHARLEAEKSKAKAA